MTWLPKAYVITRQGSDRIEAPVFHAGESGEEEAVAVFTSEVRANAYLTDADWEESDRVVELSSIDLLCWLVETFEDGTQFLVVNPDREGHEAELPQPVLSIREQLEALGNVLTDRLSEPAPQAPVEPQKLDIYHCQECGAIVEQNPGEAAPVCCGRQLVLAAETSKTA